MKEDNKVKKESNSILGIYLFGIIYFALWMIALSSLLLIVIGLIIHNPICWISGIILAVISIFLEYYKKSPTKGWLKNTIED